MQIFKKMHPKHFYGVRHVRTNAFRLGSITESSIQDVPGLEKDLSCDVQMISKLLVVVT